MDVFEIKPEAGDRNKGIVGTIIVHAIILLLFAFLALSNTVENEPDGIVIDFGDMADGMGNQNAQEIEPNPTPNENPVETPQEQVTPPVQAQPPTQSQTNAVTQDFEESIAIKEQKKKERAEAERVAKEEAERLAKIEADRKAKAEQDRKIAEARARASSALGGAKGTGNSNGEGNTTGNGNQGDPKGDPRAQYSGTGGNGTTGPGGNGTGGIGNRKWVKRPPIFESGNVEGVIVVDVCVDATGNVTSAEINREKSKGVGINALYPKALAAARQAKVVAASTDKQCGPVYFDLKNM